MPEPLATPASPPPDSGEMTVRVRYCECDPMGLAHHASYVPWFEMGRSELLRACGVTYADLEAAGVLLVVTRLDVSYKSPARYDDALVLLTRVAGGGRARIDHDYELWRDAGDGRGRTELICTARTTVACVDTSGRVRALPEWLQVGRRRR